ncbi:hypothetical protein QN277_013052 [Acacia crassicarpa]|uniref:Protein pelota homolog n=1 Tax=Acacia crassicarpa TaxID=499986 RepID=A0AAE1N2S3_9FABA|nr:hypothetical protein QN277_013052 [Acacia crassicarpa]
MKLLNKNFEPNEPGSVEIIPQEPDDLWMVYNLIANGDIVTANTTRKVYLGLSSSTKSKPKRVTVSIPVRVSCTDFDKDSSTVRVQGTNMDEANKYIEYGSFHTLTLERNKGFELFKKIWDSTSVAALSEAFKKPSATDLAVVLIQDSHAEVFLVGNGLTKLCSKIEASRRKSTGGVCFQDLFDAFVKHVDFRRIKSAMIVSAGTTKDKFRRFLLSEARRLRMRRIEDNESRIVVAECKKDDLNLKEVLSDNGVMDLIKNRKVGSEIRDFRKLWDLVDKDSSRACYGAKHVQAAHEMAAIETLLITDDLYRSSDIETRRKYTNFAKSVKKGGGKVVVYSSMDASAQQLAQLTGLAAILRFPLPYLEEDVGV